MYSNAATCDLGLDPNKIYLSKDVNNLIAGETVRAYTKVINYGDIDANAVLGFYILNKFIGQAAVSVLNSGVADEVFIDFTIPNNDFNVEVKLLEVSPTDVNLKNNSTLTQLYKVKKDSDGDGVLDVNDLYPNDPSKWKDDPIIIPPPPVEQPKVEVQKQPVVVAPKVPASTNKEVVTKKTISKEDVALQENKRQEALNEAVAFYRSPEMELLKDVRIFAEAIDWNEYKFVFDTNVKDLDVSKLDFVWNYGDGKEKVINDIHRFPGPGEYFVTLKVLGPFDNYLFDNLKITVSFWSWKNYWLWLILAIFGGGLGLFFFSLRLNKEENCSDRANKIK